MTRSAPYHQLTIDVPEEHAQVLAGALESFGAPAPQSVSARRMGKNVPWRVEAIFDEAPDKAALAAFLDEIVPGSAQGMSLAPLAEENWVALSQAALPPIRTQRFYVRQPHLPLPEDLGTRHVLTIEAGMAFGTGHHASTHGCLLALEQLAKGIPLPGEREARVSAQGEGADPRVLFKTPSPGSHPGSNPGVLATLSPRREGVWPRRVLDLGTGTGLLAVAAKKLWPAAHAVASDIDPLAIEVARENVRANEAPAIQCVTAPGFRHPLLAGKYDLILANILAKPLKQLAPEIAAHTARGGRVILSGILDEQAGEIANVYRLFGLSLGRRRDLEGWATLTLSRG